MFLQALKKALEKHQLNTSNNINENEVGNASLCTEYEVGFYDCVVSVLLFFIPLHYFSEMSP